MSKRDKADSKTGDQDTDDILAEMEEDGEGLPEFAGAPEEDEDDSEDEEESTDDDEDEDEDSDEDDEEEDDSENDSADEDEDDSDDDDEEPEDEEGEGEEADDDDSDGKEKNRKPVWERLRDTKKELRDTKQLLADAQAAKSAGEVDTLVDSFAKKHGFKPEAAKDLAELVASLAASKVGLDTEKLSAIDSILKRDKEQGFWSSQDKEFAKDFSKNVAPLVRKEGGDPKKVEKKLHALAFQPSYAKKSLVEIYLEQAPAPKGKPQRKVTSEGGSRASRSGGTGKNISDLSGDDIDDMDDKEFDAFSEGLGKSSKSKIVRH